MKKRPDKPIVFDYRQSKTYLASLLAWYKENGTSLRSLAKRLNVSPALLSLIAKGKRPLTIENVDIWAQTFNWNAQEVSWIKQLVQIEHSSVDGKQQAVESLSRFQVYRQESYEEVLTFKYLRKWWNVAIREMSELPVFQENEEWIQKRLLFKVSLVEIRKSLQFLNKHKLLAKYGKLRHINCQGEIYKLSLSTFHDQMLSKAVESIYKVPTADRQILGHTMVLSADDFSEAKKILEDALERISNLHNHQKDNADVYHFSFLGFPLTSIQE